MKGPRKYESFSIVITLFVLFVEISSHLSAENGDRISNTGKLTNNEETSANVDDERYSNEGVTNVRHNECNNEEIKAAETDESTSGEHREGEERNVLNSSDPHALVNDPRESIGDIFNPVLENSSALEEWLLKQAAPPSAMTGSHVSYTAGSRGKRSVPSLWCDSGYQCSQSLCPWEEMLDVDPSRTPMIVKYARCLTSTCNFNFAGLDPNIQNMLQLHTTCDYIRTDVRVRVNRQEQWLTDWPIACMCTRQQHTPVMTPDVTLNRMPSMSFRPSAMDDMDNVPNNAGYERRMQDVQPQPRHISRQARRLIRQYRRQQRRRQHTESWDSLMRRRLQNNFSNS